MLPFRNSLAYFGSISQALRGLGYFLLFVWFAASNCIFRVLHSVTSQHLLLHRLYYYVLPYAQTKEAGGRDSLVVLKPEFFLTPSSTFFSQKIEVSLKTRSRKLFPAGCCGQLPTLPRVIAQPRKPTRQRYFL